MITPRFAALSIALYAAERSFSAPDTSLATSAFVSAFVNSGRVPAHLDASFRSLEKMREQADYDHDYVSTEEDARRALELAREFWTEAQRVRKEVLK